MQSILNTFHRKMHAILEKNEEKPYTLQTHRRQKELILVLIQQAKHSLLITDRVASN